MTTKSSTGIGFTGLLTLIFITLKLTDYISWNWWWVLSPLWIGLAVFLAILFIFALGVLLVAVIR